MTDVDLADVVPHSTERPKGYAAYTPRSVERLILVDRITRLFQRMKEADALPLGPRAAGYRLKERYSGEEYSKEDFGKIGDVIKRLEQDRRIDWSWVADGSAITHTASGWSGPAEFLRTVHALYERDRRADQRTVIEVYAEARETLPLIRRLCVERGVTVYSGGGCCGPNLAHKVASRAVERAVRRGQSTLLLGICDFDEAGIKNVLRPAVEHVAAFVHGSGGYAVAAEDDDGVLRSLAETDTTLSFRHLALTPEMALGLVEADPDRERIRQYIASGADIWSRDARTLQSVQKVEVEALDPVALRDLVVEAIEGVLDTDTLDRVGIEEGAQREELKTRLTAFANDMEEG